MLSLCLTFLYYECPGMMQRLRLIHQMVIMFAMTIGVIKKRYVSKNTSCINELNISHMESNVVTN